MERANKKYPQSKLFPELNLALHFFTVAEVSIILRTRCEIPKKRAKIGLLTMIFLLSGQKMGVVTSF